MICFSAARQRRISEMSYLEGNMTKLTPFLILLLHLLPMLVPAESPAPAAGNATPRFSEAAYRAHLGFLASDLCEGRAPGTRGGDLAALYIAGRFQAAGLRPISPETGYYQPVPMMGNRTHQDTVQAALRAGDHTFPLEAVTDIVLGSELPREEVALDEDLWFVGYGVQAPEYDWNDYRDFDPAGKVLVMLVNDPDFSATGFGSESLTYYGRWTYKEEIARIMGAKGVIMVHTPETATYGWEVVQSSWTVERVQLHAEIRNPSLIQGWIARPALDKALSPLQLDFDKLKVRADSREFRPFPLGLTLTARFRQSFRTFTSPNVIGLLPGTDLAAEAVMYMAHYDHLGVGREIDGDAIYNGAVDNASGTAAVICLAEAFAAAPPPRRTMVFMATTGEETGLLGSEYYAEHPVVPLDKTAIILNKDCCNFYGRRDGFGLFPAQYTDAVDTFRSLGEQMGLELHVGGVDRGGGAFRVDNFPFCARGVVGLSVGLGGQNLTLSAEEEKALRQRVGRWYHQPNDEIYPFFRYDGVLQEMRILTFIGRHYAAGAPSPRLVPGHPFTAAIRVRDRKYVSPEQESVAE